MDQAKVVATNKADSNRIDTGWWVGSVARLHASRVRLSNQVMYPVTVTIYDGAGVVSKQGWAVGN